MRTTLAILMLTMASMTTHGQTTGNATANTCSIGNTGSNVSQLTIYCGVGQQQGKTIIQILNKILANQLDTDAVMAKLEEIAEAQKAAAAANRGQVTGDDNTVVNDPRSIQGSRNTIVGATDSNGNTIIPGGTAIGYGAHADPTPIAIGSGARAGSPTQDPNVNCPNNAGNCAGVNNGTQVVQGYIPPPFRVVTKSQGDAAVAILQTAEPGASVEFSYIGSTGDPEIRPYFDQLGGIFHASGWQVQWVSTTGEETINFMGAVSHPQGTSCFVNTDSKAGEIAKQAMAALGINCGVAPLVSGLNQFNQRIQKPGYTPPPPPPPPDVSVTVATRIVPSQ